MHQMIPTLTHFILCPVVLWILGLPDAVWEDLEQFLPEPQEAKNRSCLGPFLSLGLLSEDFWVEIVACGQSGERAYRFRFLTCLKNSNSPIPILDALVHFGNKGFVSKEWPELVLLLLFPLGLSHCFSKQVSEPARLVWTLGIFGYK